MFIALGAFASTMISGSIDDLGFSKLAGAAVFPSD
jgi:hypothetical protein